MLCIQEFNEYLNTITLIVLLLYIVFITLLVTEAGGHQASTSLKQGQCRAPSRDTEALQIL